MLAVPPLAVAPPEFAAIDLGTNNCRLLIATYDPAQPSAFRVVDGFSRMTRLGEGASAQGQLTPTAMTRTIAGLRQCLEKIQHRPTGGRVVRQRAVATEACRIASNCQDFLAQVQNELGLALEVIDTEEEARLAMLGCAPLLQGTGAYGLIFDIGGGSTEIIFFEWQGKNPILRDHVSVPAGVVTLTEEFGQDLVQPADYQTMLARVQAVVAPFVKRHQLLELLGEGRLQVAGCSGTITTLAAAEKNLWRYSRAQIDGCTLAVPAALALTQRLSRLDLAGRAAIPSIGAERADLMVAGCAIFEAIVTVLGVESLRVGDRGLRDGILTDLARDWHHAQSTQ